MATYDPTQPPKSLQEVVAASEPDSSVTASTKLLTADMKTVEVQGLPFATWTKGVYIGTEEPELISYAEFHATGTGYWAWIDISSAGGGVVNVTASVGSAAASGSASPASASAVRFASGTAGPANATGAASPLYSSFTRYVTATITAVEASGSAGAVTATASQDGVVNAAGVTGSAEATGTVSPVTGAAVRFEVAVTGSAGAAGTTQALVAAAISFAQAATGQAAATGGAGALSAAYTRYEVATVAAANGTGAAAPVTATASQGASSPSSPFVVSAAGGDTTVTISYVSGGTGATSYDLKWGTVAGSRPNTISGITLPYTHTGRENGTTYYYSVVATNASGSTESAEVSAAAAASGPDITDFETGMNGWTGAQEPLWEGVYDSVAATGMRLNSPLYADTGDWSYKITTGSVTDVMEYSFPRAWVLTKTMICASGNITIRAKSSIVHAGNVLDVFIDGVVAQKTPEQSLTTSYVTYSFPVTTGNHTIEIFVYRNNSGTDPLYLDNITVPT